MQLLNHISAFEPCKTEQTAALKAMDGDKQWLQQPVTSVGLCCFLFKPSGQLVNNDLCDVQSDRSRCLCFGLAVAFQLKSV